MPVWTNNKIGKFTEFFKTLKVGDSFVYHFSSASLYRQAKFLGLKLDRRYEVGGSYHRYWCMREANKNLNVLYKKNHHFWTTIEKGVPLFANGARSHYMKFLMSLEIGDSFLINSWKTFEKIYRSARLCKIKILCRKQGHNCRVWRIA